MPLSPHRPTLATILVAVVATLAAVGLFGRATAATTPNAIAERAMQDLGTWQGECWQWMKRVVFEATGKTVGFSYREGYLEAGAAEVSLEEAGPGDIIQIADERWTSPDADYPGLHTAIILEANGDGTFDVIDSNQLWDGIVRLRPGYDPVALSSSRGLSFHIYRITAGSTPSLAAGTPHAGSSVAFAPGDRARVNTPGECLNLRTEPVGDVITCIAHGTSTTVIGGPVASAGLTWVQVQTPSGAGWMATAYLQKEPSAAASPSGTGGVNPVFQYRAFIPLASSD
jgi:hypothetical protein